METVHSVYRVAAVAGVVVAFAAMWARRTGSWGHVGAQLAALQGPIGAANVVAAVVGVVVGAWCVAAASGALGLIAVARSAPVGLRRRSGPSPSPNVTLSTANVLVHNRRFRELARRLLDDDNDILLLQEVTPEHAEVLHDLVQRRPDLHLLVEPRDDYAGWATVSHHPVRTQGRIDVPGWPIPWVVIDHPLTPIRVVNVHTAAPRTAGDQATWESQMAILAAFSCHSTPTVLAGDFNASADHRSLRRLLDAGFTDAFDRVGRGWGATWPAHRCALPLLRLDHVLVDAGLTAYALDALDLVGSDHRGLRAVLRPTVTGAATPMASAHRRAE